jgi:hypothetical protein
MINLLILATACLSNLSMMNATDWVAFVKELATNPCMSPANSLYYALYFTPLIILFLGIAIRTDALVAAGVTSFAGILLGLLFMTIGWGDMSLFIVAFFVTGIISIGLLSTRGNYIM